MIHDALKGSWRPLVKVTGSSSGEPEWRAKINSYTVASYPTGQPTVHLIEEGIGDVHTSRILVLTCSVETVVKGSKSTGLTREEIEQIEESMAKLEAVLYLGKDA